MTDTANKASRRLVARSFARRWRGFTHTVNGEDPLADLFMECANQSRGEERAACAKIAEMPMGDILLACGEMTAQERRTVRAVLDFVAEKIRSMA